MPIAHEPGHDPLEIARQMDAAAKAFRAPTKGRALCSWEDDDARAVLSFGAGLLLLSVAQRRSDATTVDVAVSLTRSEAERLRDALSAHLAREVRR